MQERRAHEQHPLHGVEGKAPHRAEAFVAMKRSEDRSQSATTRHAKRYDNRTVADTTRYPEGGTSRALTGPERTRGQPREEGREGGSQERAGQTASTQATKAENETATAPTPPNSSKEREEPRSTEKGDNPRSAEAEPTGTGTSTASKSMHGRETRTPTHNTKQCTKELESVSIPAQSADRHTQTQTLKL